MDLRRSDYVKILLPDGVPKLWCPPLTHFREGDIDEERIRAHLRFLAPWVKGLLVPGTTGEGWELTDGESSRLLRFALEQARELGQNVLVGILKASAGEMIAAVRRVMREIELERAAANRGVELLRALHERGIAGFTFCAPRGSNLSQDEIHSALDRLLQMGLPSALYQLPQVTGNEISPEVVQALAAAHANLLLFKDSSGEDRVLTSGRDFKGMLFLRGAEGDYFEWYADGPATYDGFLLSTANCFARKLSEIVSPDSTADHARQISHTITATIGEVFNVVQPIGRGNIFTNGNKAIDHFNAFGPSALASPGPRLHDGTIISGAILENVQKVLDRNKLLPERGYLNNP